MSGPYAGPEPFLQASDCKSYANRRSGHYSVRILDVDRKYSRLTARGFALNYNPIPPEEVVFDLPSGSASLVKCTIHGRIDPVFRVRVADLTQ